mmetsp:Transcript_21246/g.22666  ORF Transcript_21246/g.22666 Transcript_21246/m.22666 type:complete len:111 (-) Transcript_21246:3-335(-)
MRLSTYVFIATFSSVGAFAPISNPTHSITQLEAENSSRRKAIGAIGASLGAALLFPQSSSATGSINPALQTMKGRKKGKGQFIPGKGMHMNEEYDRLMAITNPALDIEGT